MARSAFTTPCVRSLSAFSIAAVTALCPEVFCAKPRPTNNKTAEIVVYFLIFCSYSLGSIQFDVQPRSHPTGSAFYHPGLPRCPFLGHVRMPLPHLAQSSPNGRRTTGVCAQEPPLRCRSLGTRRQIDP